MTIHALITGTLYRPAESRTSKNGKVYAKATIKEVTGDETRWVNVIAFSESVIAELLRLAAGDCLSVQGQLTTSIYAAAEGTAKLSLSIVASNVLALRQPSKERKPKPRAARPAFDEHCRPFDDEIDFGGAP
jgi:single-stranded DNA-binding protein